MDEEVAESWEEAADSGVNNERLHVPSVQGEKPVGSSFLYLQGCF